VPSRSAAEITLVVDGSRMELKVSMLSRGGSAFLADFYGPFGSHLACMERESGRNRLTVGSSVTEPPPGTPLAVLVDFGQIPFTFDDFIRILRGTYAAEAAPEGPADTVRSGRREVRSVWEGDSLRRELVTGVRSCDVRSAAIGDLRAGGGWRLAFSEFRDGVPGQARLTIDDRNYFVLRYRVGE